MLVWENPPARNTKHDLYGIAGALRSKPGEWARMPEDMPVPYATRIKRGSLRSFEPAGSFEARTVQGVVYARYVGGK